MTEATDDDRFVPIADLRPDDRSWPELHWPPAPEVRLTGRHVELTPFDADRDAAELFEALDADAVWRHLPGRPADAGSYGATLTARRQAGWLVWVVRLRHALEGLPAGTVAGTTSYLDVSVPDARLEIGSTSYRPQLWGGQVNPDTKLALLTYAFETLGAGRVQLKTDVRNVRSQQAIARLGAQYEGTLRRYQRRADQTVRDTVLFAITAEQWPAVRDRLRARLAG